MSASPSQNFQSRPASVDRVRSALAVIDPGDRETWLRMAMAVKSEFSESGFPIWDDWSKGSDAYNPRDTKDVWKSIRPDGKVTIGTLFFAAKANGWRDSGDWNPPSQEEVAERRRVAAERAKQEAIERTQKQGQAAWRAGQIWSRAQPAPADHPYLVKKRIVPHGIRQTSSGDLVIPLWDGTQIASLQFIGSDGGKRFLPGGKTAGCWFHIGEAQEGRPILIGEGYATCATLHQEAGLLVLVAFNAGNLMAIARKAREAYPDKGIIIAGDNDAWTPGNPGLVKARSAARAIRARILIPNFDGMDLSGKPTDWNDFYSLRDQVRQEVAA